MRRKIFGVLFALVLGLSLSLAMAAPIAANGETTYYVSTTGDDTTGDGSLGNPWATIGYAISQAISGDSIKVAAGTYVENITLKDGVDVLGAGASVTTIDGGGSGSVVTASGVGESTKLDGFTITNGNAAGGGMHNDSASPTVINCTFYNNSVPSGSGGGMWNENGSDPVVTNCVFYDNYGNTNGGGMANDSSSPTVTNCTFYGNTCVQEGGGMYNKNGSSPEVTNCIFWGSGLWVIHDDGTSSATVTYCDVEGGYGAPADNNINANPLFVAPGTGNFHLQAGSPCIDAGDNDAPERPYRDFDGNLRLIDGDGDLTPRVDMGADEYQPVYYVATDGNNGNDGLSWPTAWRDIQHAIDQCLGGEIINVAAGTYFEFITLINGVEVLGAGDDVTAIDGGYIDTVVTAIDVSPATVISGFTIKNGSANYGGGMYNNDASPTVTDCTFSGNSAVFGGGGMYNNNSSPYVTGCTFSGNSADFGGGMGNFLTSSPTVTGCTFDTNTAVSHGGGMANDNNSSPEVTGCDFTGNEAEYGGGMYNNYYSSPILDTCTFTTNTAVGGDNTGGGMYNTNNVSPILTNCDFTGNTADYGGGMYNIDNCTPTLDTCTFTGNTADYGGGMYNYWYCSPILDTCTFTTNTAAQDGGGMYNEINCLPQLTDCDFDTNTATEDGGGMYNEDGCSPTLDGCDFLSNNAVSGGGMCNEDYSSPILDTCTFTGNHALGYNGGGMYNHNSSPAVTGCTFTGNTAYGGGGMYNSNDSSAVVTNCTFTGNTADTYGGGMYNYSSDPVVANCTFHYNEASFNGGGMYNEFSDPVVTNCTFYNNSTKGGQSGGMYNDGSAPIVTNCIFWGDTPEEIIDNYSTPVVTYCDVEGGYGVPADNNINADPLFIDPGTGDFHLPTGSPCVDVGFNDAATAAGLTTDFDGEPRIINDVVDMGVDECLNQVWVDDDWAGASPGDEVDTGKFFDVNAFATIQEGVDAVLAGGTVSVYPSYPGAYVEPATQINKSLTLESVSADWHDTIIDFYVPNCFDAEIVIMDITSPYSGDAVISGFTITGSTYGIYIPDGMAAGSSLTVSNCLIYDNGTGISADNFLEGDIFIDDCIIAGSKIPDTGIHLGDVAGTVEITNSVIGAYYDTEDTTRYDGNAGDGIDIDVIEASGTVLIDNCKIVDNGGNGIADGVYGCYGQLTITNNIIGTYDYDLATGAGEVSGNDGYGIFIDHVADTGVVTIEGNRIAENSCGISFNPPTPTIHGEVIINNNYIGAWTQSDGVNYNQYTGNDSIGIDAGDVASGSTLIIINNKIAQNSYEMHNDTGLRIDTTSGDVVISANIIGAWTEDVPGVGPITYGGNGGPGIRIHSVAAGSLLIHGNTVSENTEPASGIHIDQASNDAEVNIHLNNIFYNDGFGIYYFYAGDNEIEWLDAENNWWGDASGPGPVGPGTGNRVSDNVTYTPWLEVTVENALAGDITDATLDATAANNTEVIVTGNATVTTAQYSADPGTGGFDGGIGKYIDVHVDDPAGVTEIEIRLYYTQADIAGLVEDSLSLSWFDGASWVVCSDSGVNTTDIPGPPAYSGYIWAKLRSDTTPTLAQLTGSIFGGGGTIAPPPVWAGDTNAPLISNVLICYEGVTETTADICWITDEPATSQVEYEASPGMLSPLDTNLVTVHHVHLTGLTPGTTYNYRTMSRDMYFNLAISEWFTFTTLGGRGTPSAVFISSDLSISPAEVSSGETVNISVLVTNTGDLAGSYQVVLKINDEVEETREVTLDAGASESLTFTLSREEAGSYSVLIDSLSGSFTVEEQDAPEPTLLAEVPEEDDSPVNNWPIVGGVIAAVVIIGPTIYFTVRRRSS